MILLRWVAILWAVICVVGLFFAPHGWPSTALLVLLVTLLIFIWRTCASFPRPDSNSRKADHDVRS